MEPKLHVHTNVDIANIRKPYKRLDEYFGTEHLVSHEPMGQFKKWFEEAVEYIDEPNAFCLSTATKDGKPSNRFLLMKDFDENGFKFYTNYDSRKGKELEENPFASMCFYWPSMSRSIRIDGRVEKLSDVESTEYFNSRPIDSQISACISKQSQPVPNRQYLLDQRQKYIDNSLHVQKPERWGGFLVIPHTVEFYQGQTNRLSDRIQFRRISSESDKNISIDSNVTHQGTHGWIYERLSP
ncbi:unnamed protein product [Rotaria sp. Silwood1]|nr:unnamed protein product [Rotaria sp. Silwood1]CAF1578630.1 unnamed protein product [Rotaria sp. Silwood1]CAF1578900.1 unnamed protein product [Rotaria sp. Silwood1]CAF3688189.1 unnamed protein product [Rotaria sp. Silwood1]CAF3851368.1 unnamed protein product [Rotaria sp. Silwood1]